VVGQLAGGLLDRDGGDGGKRCPAGQGRSQQRAGRRAEPNKPFMSSLTNPKPQGGSP